MKKNLLFGIILSLLLLVSCQQQTTTSQPVVSEPVVVTFNFIPDSTIKNNPFSVTLGIVNNGDTKISSNDFKVRVIEDYFKASTSDISLSEELDKESNAIISIDSITPTVDLPQNEMQRTYNLNLEYRFLYGGSSDIVMCFVNPITMYDARKKAICSEAGNKISNSKNYIVLGNVDVKTAQNYATLVFNFQKVNSNVKVLPLKSIEFNNIRNYLTNKYKGNKEGFLLKLSSLPNYAENKDSYCLIPNEKGGYKKVSLQEMATDHEVYLTGNSAQVKCKFVLSEEGKKNLDAPSYGFKDYIQFAYTYVVIGKLTKAMTIINEG